MTSRERVINAFEFKPVDAVPVEFHPSPSGFYEHGEKLRNLLYELPCDFEECRNNPITYPEPKNIMPDGSYHAFETDEWGVGWELRIFGIMGHPYRRPLDDLSYLKDYKFPSVPYDDPAEFESMCRSVKQNKKSWYVKRGAFPMFQKMLTLRKYEDVLMDIMDDTEEINYVADQIADMIEKYIDYYAKAGVDAFAFFDDFGTANDLIMSKDVWTSFFGKRYSRLIKRAKDHGMKTVFHSCGQVSKIIDDLRRMGVDAIWPQLAVYNLKELADHCRDIGLATALHIDRAAVMTNGTPDIVRETVEEMVEAFKVRDGGSWFYIEIDNGFPYGNIEALVKAVKPYTRTK
jgi:uroporphyrinogen decarboxylase